jgi:hypothetical protein
VGLRDNAGRKSSSGLIRVLLFTCDRAALFSQYDAACSKRRADSTSPGTRLAAVVALGVVSVTIFANCSGSSKQDQQAALKAEQAESKADQAEAAANRARAAALQAKIAADRAQKAVEDATREINRVAEHLDRINHTLENSE